jgi:hypothetical protein
MAKDSHQRAAEYHNLAAHAHEAAAASHGKGDHQSGPRTFAPGHGARHQSLAVQPGRPRKIEVRGSARHRRPDETQPSLSRPPLQERSRTRLKSQPLMQVAESCVPPRSRIQEPYPSQSPVRARQTQKSAPPKRTNRPPHQLSVATRTAMSVSTGEPKVPASAQICVSPLLLASQRL